MRSFSAIAILAVSCLLLQSELFAAATQTNRDRVKRKSEQFDRVGGTRTAQAKEEKREERREYVEEDSGQWKANLVQAKFEYLVPVTLAYGYVTLNYALSEAQINALRESFLEVAVTRNGLAESARITGSALPSSYRVQLDSLRTSLYDRTAAVVGMETATALRDYIESRLDESTLRAISGAIKL